jgi:hypothetical protein
MYDLYKGLRNQLRKLALPPSVFAIHSYVQYLQFREPFPAGVEVTPAFFHGPGGHAIHPWELDLLAKEVLLNAGARGSNDLLSWRGMSSAINVLRDLENEIHVLYRANYEGKALIAMFRHIHRQVPWQRRPSGNRLVRYFKVFSKPALNQLLLDANGVDAQTLYRFGLAMTGIFMSRAMVTDPIQNELPGLTDDQFRNLLSRFTRDLPELKVAIEQQQSYDEDYVYTFNELKVTPIVRFFDGAQPLLAAPIPTHLFSRFTEGVYYVLVGVPGFSDAFGPAFQAYVGEVIVAARLGGRYELLEERQYVVNHNAKHTVDWVLRHDSAELFIECKASRVRYAAKIALSSLDELEADLERLAGAIVQVYKTMEDAKQGRYPHWQTRDLPLYPIIVTLEDWFVFGDGIVPRIDRYVERKLADAGLDAELLQREPYSICSVEDFEDLIRVIKQVGIERVMNFKTTGERRRWVMHSALTPEFREALHAEPYTLFPYESRRIGLLDDEAE